MKINAAGVTAAFQKMNEKGGIASHVSGISLYSSGDKDGQWSGTDRAYGAFYGALTRGWLGGAAGSLVGVFQSYQNPDAFDVKPTGIKNSKDVVTETNTETKKNPETEIVTTTVTTTKTTTVTKKNLATGKDERETKIEKNAVVTEECGGKKCAGDDDGKDKSGDAGCEDPHDLDYRSTPLTPEQQAQENKRFKQQADIIKGSLILLTEPRKSPEGESARFTEWVKNKMDSTVNPGFNLDKVERGGTEKPFVRFDPLFDPQREAMRARIGK